MQRATRTPPSGPSPHPVGLYRAHFTHLRAFVLAKFLPVTDNTVPPIELPIRGETDARIAPGAY